MYIGTDGQKTYALFINGVKDKEIEKIEYFAIPGIKKRLNNKAKENIER